MDNIKNHKASVIDQVYDQLKANILGEIWKPGEKIPSENDLASSFGVSRMSIRMAIQKLVTLGLLEAKVGEGTFVKEFSPSNYFGEIAPTILKTKSQVEILQFRRAIETEAIILAIDRVTDEEIGELELIIPKIFRAVEEKTQTDMFGSFSNSIIRFSKCPETVSLQM